MNNDSDGGCGFLGSSSRAAIVHYEWATEITQSFHGQTMIKQIKIDVHLITSSQTPSAIDRSMPDRVRVYNLFITLLPGLLALVITMISCL